MCVVLSDYGKGVVRVNKNVFGELFGMLKLKLRIVEAHESMFHTDSNSPLFHRWFENVRFLSKMDSETCKKTKRLLENPEGECS